MMLKNQVDSITNLLKSYFQKYNKPIREKLSNFIMYSTLSASFNTQNIVRKASEINGLSFDANNMKLFRLLDTNQFQVDDTMFRCYFNFLFDSFIEKGLKNGDNLQINIDYTTSEDKFLILHASIIFQDINYPLYFSLRSEPNKTANFSYKALEKAFIRSLKHHLSKNYKYTIVADRGFGNDRFMSICAENGFDFVIRLNENLRIKIDQKLTNLKEFQGKNEEFEAFVVRWKKDLNFQIKTQNNSTWFIASNKQNNSENTYENRWKIEQMFKNMKSSGFDIENTKIRNYSSMKKMLFIFLFAYTICLFVGDLFDKNSKLKKKFKNHMDLFCQFSV